VVESVVVVTFPGTEIKMNWKSKKVRIDGIDGEEEVD